MNSRVVTQKIVNSTQINHVLERRRSAGVLSASALLVLVTASLYAAGGATNDAAGGREAERERIGNVIPQLRSLERTKANDREVQLGLAILYRDYDSSEGYSERRTAQDARVLKLDPNNKIIWQMRAIDASGSALRMQRDLVDYLERLINNAQTYGRQHVSIRTGRSVGDPVGAGPDVNYAGYMPLHDVLGDRTGNDVEIDEKDYDRARAKVRQRADSELNQALNAVDEAEKHDPDNAFYSYLKTELYFDLKQPVLAVQELRTAVSKPLIQRYPMEKQKAVTKALEGADVPTAVRSHVGPVSPFGDHIQSLIWERYVEPLVMKMEDDGNLDQAKEICRLAVSVAKQIREEPLPYESAYNKDVSVRMERWAVEHSAAIDKRKAEKSKPPENEPQPQKK